MNDRSDTNQDNFTVKVGLAEMLKGGVIMDVVTPEHARIAEEAGAVAVMALERVPADIRADGGVARMSDPEMILEIMEAVSIAVMAKARIGHFVEAQILEAIGVDYIDESEVLTPADEAYHINKHDFKIPFVCGCRNLGEALRRIGEGAAMIRTKGEAGTGDVVEAVRWYTDLFLTYGVAPYEPSSGEMGRGGFGGDTGMRLVMDGQAAMWFGTAFGGRMFGRGQQQEATKDECKPCVFHCSVIPVFADYATRHAQNLDFVVA